MRKSWTIAAWLAVSALLSAQNPARSFDAASVKPVDSPAETSVINGRAPGRFTAANSPLQFVLLYAFRVRTFQLVGLPNWAASTRYNITGAYTPGEQVNEDAVREMVRTLLTERFHLVVHREMRDVPAYNLVLARSDGRLGPQLARSEADCDGKRAELTGGGPSPVAPSGQRPSCGLLSANGYITAGTRPVSELAANLGAAAARPIVDKTGLSGNFNIDVKWTAIPAGTDDVSIFTALQEQLGLKLESSTTRADVVVIDRLERPTEN